MKSIALLNISESELKTLVNEAVKEALAAQLHSFLPQIIRPPSQPDIYLSRQQVCDLLQISLPTLSTYVKAGVIKEKRIGQTIRYLKKDIMEAAIDVRSMKFRK
jgi:hypothetical protein